MPPGTFRRLSVACETRIPKACVALASERNILGRLLYKNARPHHRHQHFTKTSAVFKGADALLDGCDISLLQKLATEASNSVTEDGRSSLDVNDRFLTVLKNIEARANHLRTLAQDAGAAVSALVVHGFFVPYALGACAVLGRVFSLASDIHEAAVCAQDILTKSQVSPAPGIRSDVSPEQFALGAPHEEQTAEPIMVRARELEVRPIHRLVVSTMDEDIGEAVDASALTSSTNLQNGLGACVDIRTSARSCVTADAEDMGVHVINEELVKAPASEQMGDTAVDLQNLSSAPTVDCIIEDSADCWRKKRLNSTSSSRGDASSDVREIGTKMFLAEARCDVVAVTHLTRKHMKHRRRWRHSPQCHRDLPARVRKSRGKSMRRLRVLSALKRRSRMAFGKA